MASSSSPVRLPQNNEKHGIQISSLPMEQQSIVLASRIKKTCKTVESALALMESCMNDDHTNNNNDWEEAWFATLRICGNHKDYQQAVRIVQEHIPQSDQCRSLAIAICGRCHQIEPALGLLESNSISTPAPYNAAIAACGTNKAWKDALNIVQHKMPKQLITTLTGNAVLTALAKSQQGLQALTFLRSNEFPQPRDRASYHHTLAALLAQGDCLEQAVELVIKDMTQEAKTNPLVAPNQETYDRLMAAIVAKKQQTEGDDQKAYYNTLLQHLDEASHRQPIVTAEPKKKKRKRTETADAAAAKRAKLFPTATRLPWDFEKWPLPKHGKGKSAWWQLGVYDDTTIRVGLHPNRNPNKNGIQLWFFRDGTNQQKPEKLGYLLMINTPSFNTKDDGLGTSQFLGLRVTDEGRRQGSAKIFLAIWLQCCFDANLQPVTGKMNKPLLCLILQHAFGFAPIDGSGGVRALLLPSEKGQESVVRLTPASSSGVKNLAGALSPRDVQEQNVQFVAPTNAGEGGRPIVVGGLLRAPCTEDLEESVSKVLKDKWKVSSEIVTGKDGSKKTSEGSTDAERPLTMSRLFLGI